MNSLQSKPVNVWNRDRAKAELKELEVLTVADLKRRINNAQATHDHFWAGRTGHGNHGHMLSEYVTRLHRIALQRGSEFNMLTEGYLMLAENMWLESM